MTNRNYNVNMRRKSVAFSDPVTSKPGVSEHVFRLKNIFSHHRSKGAKAEQLAQEKAELRRKYEEQREEKERIHQQRLAVVQKQIKSLEARLLASQEKIKSLEKDVIDAQGGFGAEKQRSAEMAQHLETMERDIANAESLLRGEQVRNGKLSRELSEVLEQEKISKAQIKMLEKSKTKLQSQLGDSHHLQNNLTELMNKKDQEVRELESQVKEMRQQAGSLEAKLKVEMKVELGKHLRIRDSQHVQEIGRLTESMKAEHKKNVADYKEAVMAKNHDIENLKESNTRMKKVVNSLKQEKETLLKEKREQTIRLRQLETQMHTDSSEISTQAKKNESLLHELRSKYIEKTSELEQLHAKYKDLEDEINTYRSLIESEEKEFISTKRKREDSSATDFEPPKKKQRLLEGTIQQFDLHGFDLNQNCLILKCVHSKGASLEGWKLVNGDQTKHFNLPHTQFFPNEKRRILIGRGVRPDKPTDILWREDVWDGYSTEMIQLLDPDGSVVSLINLHTDFLPINRRSSTCILM